MFLVCSLAGTRDRHIIREKREEKQGGRKGVECQLYCDLCVCCCLKTNKAMVAVVQQ